jgi:osmotically-inducible protein OsmY
MKSDRELQDEVIDALEWEPGVSAAQIGVTVSDGVITLRGSVSTLQKKLIAERAARHLVGVRAIANELEVSPPGGAAGSDPVIAEVAANALEWDSAVPDGAVKVTVRNGWVTLTGTVALPLEKSAAELAVRRLYGVRGVANAIVVQPSVSAGDVKARIEAALKCSAVIDSQRIGVEARSGEVVLTGAVRSLAERDDAERAAWAAPGVTKVVDRLVVATGRSSRHVCREEDQSPARERNRSH